MQINKWIRGRKVLIGVVTALLGAPVLALGPGAAGAEAAASLHTTNYFGMEYPERDNGRP